MGQNFIKKAFKIFALLTMLATALFALAGCATVELIFGVEKYTDNAWQELQIKLDLDKISASGVDVEKVKEYFETRVSQTNGWETYEVDDEQLLCAYVTGATKYEPFANMKAHDRKYGFFFYIYDFECENPFKQYLTDVVGFVDDVCAQFPELASFKQTIVFKFSYAIPQQAMSSNGKKATYLVGSEGNYYFHTWESKLSEISDGSADDILIRRYRVNTDGWYTLAVLIAGAVLALAIPLAKKVERQKKEKQKLMAEQQENDNESNPPPQAPFVGFNPPPQAPFVGFNPPPQAPFAEFAPPPAQDVFPDYPSEKEITNKNSNNDQEN